jgi:hypothetical protein
MNLEIFVFPTRVIDVNAVNIPSNTEILVLPDADIPILNTPSSLKYIILCDLYSKSKINLKIPYGVKILFFNDLFIDRIRNKKRFIYSIKDKNNKEIIKNYFKKYENIKINHPNIYKVKFNITKNKFELHVIEQF